MPVFPDEREERVVSSLSRTVQRMKPDRWTLLHKFAVLSLLCILGMTVAVCTLAGAAFRRHLVAHDASIVGSLANLLLTRSVPREAFGHQTDPALFEQALASFARAEHVQRLILYGADGRVLWSDDAALIGRRFPDNAEVAMALRGAITAHVIRPGKEEHGGALTSFARLEELYLPVYYGDDRRVVGVLEIYRDPPGFFAALDRGWAFVWLLGGGGGLGIYLALFAIVRNASRRQARLEADLAAHARALEVRVEERTGDLSRKTRALWLLYTISSTLGGSLEIRETLPRALKELLEAGGFEGGWIDLLPRDDTEAPLVVAHGVSDDLIQWLRAGPASAAHSGQTRVVEVEAAAGAGSNGFGAAMVVPIRLGDQPLGTLNLAARDAQRFAAEDVQLVSTLARQIAIAVGNARLYVAAREREREARILYETTRRFGEQADFDSLLTAVIEGAVTITRASYGGVGFPDGPDIVMRRLVPGRAPFAPLIRHKISQSLAGLTYASGQPQVANDPLHDPRVNRETARALDLQGVACSPLQIRGRVIGVLFVCNKDAGPFTHEDMVLLTTFANHAAVALDNARLRTETLRREREAFILYHTSTRLHAQTDVDALLATIVEGAIEIANATAGGVSERVGDEIVTRTLAGIPLLPGETEIRVPVKGSIAGLAYETGEPLIVNSVSEAPCDEAMREMSRRRGLVNFVCVPLRRKNATIGVIKVCNKREAAPFTDDDVRLLTTFATQAAMAIDNARLHAETVKREREASILYRTSTRLHGHTDLEALLTTIVEGAIEISEAECGGIGRLIGAEIILRPLVGFALGPEVTEIRLPVTDSTAGFTYTSGEAVIVNDLDLARCAAPIREVARGHGIRTFLCAPLKVDAETIVGVIKVCNKKGGAPFTAADLRLLTTFATQAAMAIENARLFHEIKTTKDFLEHLIESSTDAIVTVTPRGVVTFVNRAGRRMFNCGGDPAGQSVVPCWTRGLGDLERFGRLLTEQERIQNYETELYGPQQAILSVNISASVLRDGRGGVAGFLAVVRDVTKLRKLQDQMVRSERLAAAGLLAAGVAHEVGNPLACISSLGQVLLARSSDPALQRGLEDIQVHVGRIERIVQGLVRLARPAPFAIRESPLQEVIENAVQLARHNPTARNMAIETVFDPALPRIRMASDQLLQVFLNIILNAANAQGDLKIRTISAGEAVQVVFADTGRGMSEEELRRLFDPFFTTKDSDRHLGLGLFVSHEIVRQHGGTILAESQSGGGSTLTVILPVERLPISPEMTV